jgi:hypothetical protein
MLIKEIANRKIIVSVIMLTVATFGMDSANAGDLTEPTSVSKQIVIPTPTPTQTQTITPAPISPFSHSNPTVHPTGSIMKWVCKTIMTTVAISVYIYSVVESGGVTMVVAREVIKYATVPATVCEWFF